MKNDTGRLQQPFRMQFSATVSSMMRKKELLSRHLGSSFGTKSTCNAGDRGLTTGLGRPPGGGHGNPLQYFCPENSHGQRRLAGYSPWGGKVEHD